jgi:hypothetical protein
MSGDDLRSEGARAYAAAHAAHYSERDLAAALRLYRDLIASHAGTEEARYSRTQIQNIVNTLVPARELLDAQLELAFAQLKRR